MTKGHPYLEKRSDIAVQRVKDHHCPQKESRRTGLIMPGPAAFTIQKCEMNILDLEQFKSNIRSTSKIIMKYSKSKLKVLQK